MDNPVIALLSLVRQEAFHALARGWGELLRAALGHSLRVLERGLPQEADLLSIAAAPHAKSQMQPESQAFARRQRVIELF